jgi:acetoin utilization deacetylase AcuC-like enzyme
VYLSTLIEALSVIREYNPDYLIVSVGFDILDGDPVGRMQVSLAGLSQIGARIAEFSKPTLIVQEGGYNLNQLGPAARSFISSFL